MSNAQFRRDSAKIIERTKEKTETVAKRVALDLFSSMVERSPVGNPSLWASPAPAGYVGGSFRGNWQVGIGGLNTNTDSPPDESGQSSIGRAQRVIPLLKIGQTIFLTNSLPYGRRIETGWSTQAPTGVVRLTVVEYEQFIRKAAAAL